MVATELNPCDNFLWELRRSNLIDRGALDSVVGDFLQSHPEVEPDGLAAHLVDQNILTPFQAERLLAGKSEGLVLGPFVLIDSLGVGSMGSVFRAVSKNDNQEYAVKVLPRRSMWNMRIARRKVREFAAIKHPAVVAFVDVGTVGGVHYLVWPLVEGTPLDDYAISQGTLPAERVASITVQIGEALDECHARGLIHGLIKPSNILMTGENEIKILDFGIGCLLAELDQESIVDTMSTANTMASGLDCASPESIMDPKQGFSPASDQYSLGCTLYYLLTGQYPFPEENAVDKMFAHQTKQPTPVQELAPKTPDSVLQVVNRMMQKAPAGRYPKMTYVVRALHPLAEGLVPHRELEPELKPPLEETRPAPPVRPTSSRPEKPQSRNGHLKEPAKSKTEQPKPRPVAQPTQDAQHISDDTEFPQLDSVLQTAALLGYGEKKPAPTQPASAPANRPNLKIPDRRSMQEADPKPANPAPSPKRPVTPPGGFSVSPKKHFPERAVNRPHYKEQTLTLEERLGTGGIVALAIVLGVVSWITVMALM